MSFASASHSQTDFIATTLSTLILREAWYQRTYEDIIGENNIYSVPA